MNSPGVEAVPVDRGSVRDRPPLRWYMRMVRRFVGAGPYLDFGCGSGHLLRHLAEHGSASGFETAGDAAGRSRNNAPGCPVHTTLDGIPSGVYRGVVAVHTLQHLDDETVAAALACWRRVLVPGGRVLVVVPDPGGRASELAGERWTGGRDRLRSHAGWRQVFRSGGFAVVREGSDGLWNGPYGKLPAILDTVVHALPSLTQFLAGRLLVRPGGGESSVFVIEAPSGPCRGTMGG